jgi:hypothetical protein
VVEEGRPQPIAPAPHAIPGPQSYRRDPGHIANSPDDIGAAVRFSLGS